MLYAILAAISFALSFALMFLGIILTIHFDPYWLGLLLTAAGGLRFVMGLPTARNDWRFND